jgi:hypothetical protein
MVFVIKQSSSCLQIIELVDDDNIVSKEMLDDYFKTKFLPYVTSFYDASVRANTSIEDLLHLIVESLQILEMDNTEVCMVF